MQKDLTEVKIFQKVLGGATFFLKHRVLFFINFVTLIFLQVDILMLRLSSVNLL